MNEVYVDISKEKEKLKNYFNNRDFVSVEMLLDSVYDLLDEIDVAEEKLEDYKQYVEDNYRPLERSYYTGDSDDDRY